MVHTTPELLEITIPKSLQDLLEHLGNKMGSYDENNQYKVDKEKVKEVGLVLYEGDEDQANALVIAFEDVLKDYEALTRVGGPVPFPI